MLNSNVKIDLSNQNKTFKYIVLPVYDTFESKECKYCIMYSI